MAAPTKGRGTLQDAPSAAGAALERAAKREGTRSLIATVYVIGFLVLVSAALVASWVRNLTTEDIRDQLVVLSGVLSGPLGFIVGYYFKSSSEHDH
jgi:hypothetical protein